MDQVTEEPELPVATPEETVDYLVEGSRRTARGVPLRRTFLQQFDLSGERIVPGPLASFVTSGDRKALVLYLLLLTRASSSPWNVHLPAAVWARALGFPLPNSKAATSTISKAWLRLERRQLIERHRLKHMAEVTLLCEDGSSLPYAAPGAARENYLRIPLALWKKGPEAGRRWYQVLSVPELAVLLIARSHGDHFRLPFEEGPKWYGISADSIARGVHGLNGHGLMSIDKTFKKAPLSPVGYTAEHRYTLSEPMGPVGRISSSSRLAKQESS